MRFASAFFDAHGAELSAINDYGDLLKYLDSAVTEKRFLDFAKTKDGLAPKAGEWEVERRYMMTQVRALVGRYSQLGDNAYYHLFLQTDNTFKEAMRN